MTTPFDRNCHEWPRVGLFTENTDELQAAELNVHCIYHPIRNQHYFVAFVGVDREEQIGQVINLAEKVGAVVKIIDGTGFTDEVIGIMMAHQETSPDYPGGSFCCVPVEWEAAS
ncbi:MAG: hypothetical protein ACLP3C_03780 [Mycobacterium sp.]|uniref:hypothetical protein n=1 Tax=Mycobacterium sp. TaxID=1785 RepID=UPI003F96788E